ncbi:MAG: polyketide synthase dehydratase domain-containing protein [Deltaproteobacteria bacterium]|nr:polyketide synthase dehydratase domain-containing protein [Deltaproteobacteria bacterium]
MTTWQTSVAVTVKPWFADHCFNGKVVLPAVESMSLLASEMAGHHPEIDIRVMENVRFNKFLEIPGGSTRVAALIEYRRNENGSIHGKLLSRARLSVGTRLKEHGEILFSPASPAGKFSAGKLPGSPSGPLTRIRAEEIYRDLVPFGPAYHTLRDTLFLGEEEAWGKLQAPALPATDGVRALIGSPFPLDGAFHAACVLGQRHADFVPFPVGFARRLITKATQPGGSYLTRVELVSRLEDELVFNLNILDDQGEVYEAVSGLRMRDVSGGRIKPPAWIKTRTAH